jgi:hypothetical protein
MRKIEIKLSDLLGVVESAEGYGFGDDVFYTHMACWAGNVSDEEIAEYANYYLTEEAEDRGYGREDYDNSIRVLKDWRDKYCK